MASASKSIIASNTTETDRAFIRENYEKMRDSMPDLEKWFQGGLIPRDQYDQAKATFAQLEILMDTVVKVSAK